jgi:hypothetical protein
MGQTINSVVCHMLKALYSAAVWAVPAFRNSRWGIRGRLAEKAKVRHPFFRGGIREDL